MRRLILLASLALVVAGLVPTSALPGADGTNLPFKGTFTGPGSLDTGSGRLQAHLVGEFTHFGRATLAEDIQVVPIGPGAFSWSGNWTMTAANGDRVAGTSTGSGAFTDPTHSSWSVDFVSTTGTGRFADAVLTFHSDAVATTTSVVGTLISADVYAPLVGQLSK